MLQWQHYKDTNSVVKESTMNERDTGIGKSATINAYCR
jgi:hypothetical protein